MRKLIFKDKKIIWDYVKITVGAGLMASALGVFLVPFKIAPGGISGLSTVFHYITGIRVSYLIGFINIPIFILGIIKLKWGFFLRSFYGTVVLSLLTDIFGRVSSPTSDPLIAAVFGGVIMGLGIATVLGAGGTTGGTDIVVLVIKKITDITSVGRLYMIADGAVIAAAGIVFSSGEAIFYSMTALFVSSYVTDIALEGFKLTRLVYIISDKSDEVCQGIYKDLNRGVTGLKAVSMYTGENRRILMCVIGKGQLARLKKTVNGVDPAAFVIICDAKEVMGNGFINVI